MHAERRTSFTHVFNYRYLGCYHPREAMSTAIHLRPTLGGSRALCMACFLTSLER